MALTQIFSVASIILGIYLIYTFLENRKPSLEQPITKQQYHLGCFLNNHNPTESSIIANEIQVLQQRIKNNISLNMHHTNFLRVPDDFNKRSVQLAYDFQTFIEQQLETKRQMRHYVQLSKAVNKAYAQYVECDSFVKRGEDLNEVECLNNWNAYRSCFGQMQILKKNLNVAFKDKEAIVQEMQNLLSEKDPSPETKGDEISIEYEKEFKSRTRMLDERENRLELDIKILGQKISTKEYFISTLENDFKHAQELYYECHENRKEFKLCEEISKEVRSLGYGEIQKLDQWLKNKFKTLTRLQKMIEMGGSGANVDELKKLFKKGTAEYEEMLKLFIETKVKMNKHCGCSEEEEKKLKENAEKKKKEAEEKQKQIIELNSRLARLNIQLQELNAEKEKQFNLYRDKISNIPKREDSKVDKVSLLSRMSEDEKRLAQNIINFQKQFNDMELKCRTYKDKLSQKLKIIESIKSCASKQHYYKQLVEKLKRENPQGIEKQKKLRQVLKMQLENYRV